MILIHGVVWRKISVAPQECWICCSLTRARTGSRQTSSAGALVAYKWRGEACVCQFIMIRLDSYRVRCAQAQLVMVVVVISWALAQKVAKVFALSSGGRKRLCVCLCVSRRASELARQRALIR